MPPDATEIETHRAALIGHCYRMLGSIVEAEDAVQDAMVRAWRALDRFDGRSSLRTWLYRIATNVCLDALADRSRRARPMEERPAGSVDSPLEVQPRSHWLEPAPDALAVPGDADPLERTMLRQSIRLAFVAALQHLPPRQRAVLLLTEVLGWSAGEVAACLDVSVASVNSALQRARATLTRRRTAMPRDGLPPPAPVAVPDGGPQAQWGPLTAEQLTLLEAYVEAFHAYDVDRLTTLLREDGTLSMPPYTLWLQGRGPIRDWLLGRGLGCQGSRLVPTAASGSPAFGQYRSNASGEGYHPWALIVLELEGPWIASWNSFLDTGTLFPRFGLPEQPPTRPIEVATPNGMGRQAADR